MLLEEKNKHLLTRAEERISFLYIDAARIEQTEYGVQVVQGQMEYDIPVSTISCLLLGPGTSITHRAIANIAGSGCSVCWVGKDCAPFYAFGEPTTRSSKNILKQVKAHESKVMHLEVIHKMYALRYPDERLKSKSLQELRGIEGKRMKQKYESLSREYGIEWSGRQYTHGVFDESDIVNKYITASNQMLYAIAQSVISILGFSPAIGFIHTGNTLSFVYDIADLYKESITLPVSFRMAAQSDSFDRNKLLNELRKYIFEEGLMKRMAKDILELFEAESGESIIDDLHLWDLKNYIKSGRNYG